MQRAAADRSADRKGLCDGEAVVLVGILRGAVLWMGDIMKNVNLDMVIDFMAVSSYGCINKIFRCCQDQQGSGYQYQLAKNVIIVEDIVDSGTTLNYLKAISARISDAKCCEDLYAS